MSRQKTSPRTRAILWFIAAAIFLMVVVTASIKGRPAVTWLAGVGLALSLIYGSRNLLVNVVVKDLERTFEPPP
jgi:hypothetical protein